jgi:uncharacterized membrane protein YhaH (DUF805 family)
MFTLFVVIIAIALGFLDGFLGTYSETTDIGLLGSIFLIAVLVQSLAVGVRRLHDTGRSGWWLLIALIPFVGPIVLLVLMVFEGQQSENPYGPNPKQAA